MPVRTVSAETTDAAPEAAFTNSAGRQGTEAGRDKTAPVVMISCAVFSLLLTGLALHWYDAGVFEYDNTLFDADTQTRLLTLTEGWATGDINYLVHPLFELLANSAVVILSVFLQPLGWFGIDDEPSLMAAILFLPAAAGIAAYLTFDLFRALRFDGPTAYGLMIIYCLSFSAVIFGSQPEHFIFDNICLLILLRLSVQAYLSGRAIPTRSGILAGTAMIGVTVANVVPFAIIYFASLVRVPNSTVWDGVRQTLLVAGTCIVIAMAVPTFWTVFETSMDEPDAESPSVMMTIAEWIDANRAAPRTPAHLIERAGAFVVGFADSFVASPVTFWTKRNENNDEPPQLRAALRETPGHPWPYAKGLLMAAAILIGYLGWRRAGFDVFSPAGASLAIIGCYWVMLTFWGTQAFLYSQLWIAPGLILLAGLSKFLQPQIFAGAMAVFIFVELGVNGYELKRLLDAFS